MTAETIIWMLLTFHILFNIFFWSILCEEPAENSRLYDSDLPVFFEALLATVFIPVTYIYAGNLLCSEDKYIFFARVKKLFKKISVMFPQFKD